MKEKKEETDKRAVVKAAFQRFKFLGEFFVEEKIESVGVRVVNHDITVHMCGYKRVHVCDAEYVHQMGKTILLFARDEKFIGQVGVRKCRVKRWWARTPRIETEYFNESVGNALVRFGKDLDQVHYLVARWDDEDKGSRIMIAFPPNGFTLQEWLLKQLALATEEFNKSVQAVELATA